MTVIERALVDTVVEETRRRLPRFLEDLGTLVAIDSGTYSKAGVDRMSAWIGAALEELGCSVVRHPSQRYGDNIVGRLRGSGRGHVLLLCHMDTVFPDGTAAERPMRIDGNRILGPGVCDMKGGILTALHAVGALRQAGFRDFGSITLLFDSDEEVAERDSVALIEGLAGAADAVLVLEARRANGDIVTARKANAWYRLEVEGRAAHAGVEPEKGRSAVLELAHQTIALQGLNGLAAGVTVNVGVVEGGSRPNVVAERARALIDVRCVTQRDLSVVEAAMRSLAARPTSPDVRVSLVADEVTPAMERTAGTAALARVAQLVARALGFEVNEAATGGGSDGCFASAMGAAVLDGMGPIGGLDHSPHEYIELDSIVPTTAMLTLVVAEIGAHPEVIDRR